MKFKISIIVLFTTVMGYAQNNGIVTGILTDKEVKNEPLPFANAVIKGTTIGTTTDETGKYILNNTPILIVEEPELNLHPALQSKLADLFFEVHQNYDIEFLVETHSEYLIRRSQVLVAEFELEVAPNINPFWAYYFPKEIEQAPYMLQYQTDGSFDKNFGQGFFDEASASTLDLLRLKRQKKA